jgi:chorismate mutase / prephenate dehydratase
MNAKERQEKIEAIDKKLIALVNRRSRLAARPAAGKGARAAGYSPAAEEKTLRRVARLNPGPLDDRVLRNVYREILSAGRSLAGPLRIAYLGPEATFTHAAAREKFGSGADYIPSESIAGVFRDVETSAVEFGVVPIENSLEGAVTYTLDMLLDSPLQVCSEIFLRVSHCLLSNFPLPEIKVVYSHPQVFGQCRGFIQQQLAGVELREAASTARAAELAAAGQKTGALAGKLAAAIYGLKIRRRNIEDSAGNITRFLVIGKRASPPSGRDRTSLLFSLPHRAGSLHDALNAFKSRGINLTKIESRPSKKKAWEYYFFVDLEGHRNSKKVKAALEELESQAKFVKILGSYPVGEAG